jgi:hypothetical protein
MDFSLKDAASGFKNFITEMQRLFYGMSAAKYTCPFTAKYNT